MHFQPSHWPVNPLMSSSAETEIVPCILPLEDASMSDHSDWELIPQLTENKCIHCQEVTTQLLIQCVICQLHLCGRCLLHLVPAICRQCASAVAASASSPSLPPPAADLVSAPRASTKPLRGILKPAYGLQSPPAAFAQARVTLQGLPLPAGLPAPLTDLQVAFPLPKTEHQYTPKEYKYDMFLQAMELYELENPDTSMKARKEAATKMATEALYAESFMVNQRTTQGLWRPSRAWTKVCQQACMAANPEALYQVETPIRTVEPVRRVVAATESRSAWTSPLLGAWTELALDAEAAKVYQRIALKWQGLVTRIQTRKRWSDHGRLLNYSKNGLPQKLNGKPQGFGKHEGRWGWREISPFW